MNRRQADRAVIAARATPSTANPCSLLIAAPNPAAPGPVRRARQYRGTAAQRDSAGRYSDWNKSTDFFTDPRWSA